MNDRPPDKPLPKCQRTRPAQPPGQRPNSPNLHASTANRIVNVIFRLSFGKRSVTVLFHAASERKRWIQTRKNPAPRWRSEPAWCSACRLVPPLPTAADRRSKRASMRTELTPPPVSLQDVAPPDTLIQPTGASLAAGRRYRRLLKTWLSPTTVFLISFCPAQGE
jgi:hypothetical protein